MRFGCVVLLVVFALLGKAASQEYLYDPRHPCGAVVEPSVYGPIDPQFSKNACIIIADYTVADCSRAPPDRFVVDDAPNPCPGYQNLENTDQGVQLPYQVQFTQLEDAIDNCPYDPVLIEFTGTLYLSNDPFFWYNQTKDIVIRGISFEISTGGDIVQQLVLQNVTYFNSTTNMTTVVEELIAQNVTTPIVNITQAATIVGFKNWQVQAQNISITFDNVLLEGCGTEESVFLTLAKPRQCIFPEPPIECVGAYFREVDAEQILEYGTCQRTGAYFDGYRYIRPLPGNEYYPYPLLKEEATIEFWVRPDETAEILRWAGMVVVSHHHDDDDNDSGGIGIAWLNAKDPDTGNERIAFNVGQNDQFGTPVKGVIARGQWSHVAGVFNNGLQSLYINGELAEEKMRTGNVIDYLGGGDYAKNFGIQIGRAYTDSVEAFRYFNGSIDDARIWKTARTQAQIRFYMRQVVDPTDSNLVGYWRFDVPIGSEPDDYPDNLVSTYQGIAELETQYDITGNAIEVTGYEGPPSPYPSCFCENPDGFCTATDLYQEFPFEAILTDYGDVCTESENCTFVHGMVIDPNGQYGKLWLPGLVEISGPSYNETTRFIPGRFEQYPVYDDILQYNATTNTTTTISVPTGETEPVFIPGVNPSTLPPVQFQLYVNPYANYDYFMPGVFLNDGLPPFWAGNFFPGIFVPPDEATGAYGVAIPADWEEGDLVFIPGITSENGTFSQFIPGFPLLDAFYHAYHDGLTFNFTRDTEPCTIPTAPTTVEDELVPLEDEFGCWFIPGQADPEYLDPSARTPCSQLAAIRATLPAGTESLAAETVLGCDIGPDTPEPEYLDPSKRLPCFILRDLREQLASQNDTFALNCTRDGGYVQEEQFMPCLKNQNLTLFGTVVQNYYGDVAICQHACTDKVTLDVEYSQFKYIPGNAIRSSGLEHFDVHDNIFCPCGGKTSSCVYLNANHRTEGYFTIYNNLHCFDQDNIGPSCTYDIATTVICKDGVFQCLDEYATIINGCPVLSVVDDYPIFDSDCAVYKNCTFPMEVVEVILPNMVVVQYNTTVGGLEFDLPFLTPVLAELTGGNTTFTIECVEETISVPFEYEEYGPVQIGENCTMDNGPYMNETVCVPIYEIQPISMTYYQNITQCAGGSDLFSCPCPVGYKENVTFVEGGAGGLSSTGLYNTCEWEVPGGLNGEFCLDTVLYCPFSGGTLGGGSPPPIPVGLCNEGSAVLECNNATCIGGLIYYEGMNHTCDLSTCNATGYITVPCECASTVTDAGFLSLTCDRSTCIGTPCVLNATLPYGGERCELFDGMISWDGSSYPCVIPENETLCIGASYVPSHPTPADGLTVVPCNNNYVEPGPGPCSCTLNQDIGGNMTVVSNSTSDTTVYYGDPSLQLICQPDGTVYCSCSGNVANANATNSYGFAITNPECTAFHIDHIPENAALWFQQNNVAQGLPIGWRFERFGEDFDRGWDLIEKFAIKVPHFRTGHSIIYESRRLSPRITGYTATWVDGHPNQWNKRQCVEDPMTDNCTKHEFRPLPATPTCITPDPFRAPCAACVVNQDYSEKVDGFGVYRFNRIQDAINDCTYDNVIIQQATNVYEERLIIKRDNFHLLSYDKAVIVGSNHRIVGDQITVRGLVHAHPNTNDYPIYVPAKPSADFDVIQDNIESDVGGPDERTDSFALLNNEFNGDGATDVGVVIGQLGRYFRFNWNVVRNFFVRSIDIQADEKMEVRLNRFIQTTGRAFRGRRLLEYTFEENLFEDSIGVSAANEVEIVSLECYAAEDAIPLPVTGSKFEALFAFLIKQKYDPTALDEAINPLVENPDADIGCNTNIGRECYFRGNRQAVDNDQDDRSTVVFNLFRGGIQIDRIRDNMATHGFIGMKLVETPFITFSNRSELFKQNALIRVASTRKINDNPYDFGFQAPGVLLTIGCAFPDCLTVNETYPNIAVNPRYDFIISDHYGFDVIHNVTSCNFYHLPLTTYCNITSGQARVRREDMILYNDMHAIGDMDYPCCENPVIEGYHVEAADVMAFEYVDWWFLFPIASYQPGYDLFATLQEFNAYLVYFSHCNFDGRYWLYEERVRIMQIYMRVEDGDFSMSHCNFYNWWHFPNGTQLGYVEDQSQRGIIPVTILPNGDIFKRERSPDLDGIKVIFQTYQRVDLNPFIVPRTFTTGTDSLLDQAALATALGGGEAAEQYVTTRDGRVRLPVGSPTGDSIDSYFGLEDCTFEDLDGNAVRVRSPGNMYVARNRFINCGMRQYEEIALTEYEMNPDSVGSYLWENNYHVQYKPALYPYGGGGQDSAVRFAAIWIHEAGRPFRWKMFNTTVVVIEGVGDAGIYITPDQFAQINVELGPGEDNPTRLDSLLGIDGLFSDPANLGEITNEDVTPFDTTAADIVGTTLKPVLSQNGFVTEENTRVIAQTGTTTVYAGGRNTYDFDPTQRGFTVGLRLSAIDGDTIAKTLTPGRQVNYTDFYFSQEGLYYFRLLVGEFNGPNTTFALANGLYTVDQIPTDGAGIQGINADMVYCAPQSDIIDGDWAECTVCDDGCPIVPPDSCVVDPENSTFVPENPYYNTWLFDSLDDAVLLCKDTRRVIELKRQDVFPFTANWNLRAGNWTIFTNDGAVVRVSQGSVLLNAHNLVFENIVFEHYTGNFQPTVAVGTAIGSIAHNITFNNCTFIGRNTKAPAFEGMFGSLAIMNSDFSDYIGDRVLDLRSDCGMLVFEDNYVTNAPGSALYARQYDLAIVQNNRFEFCGGKFKDSPACVYLSMCFDTMVELVFSQNIHNQEDAGKRRFGEYDAFVSAYWIDGVPASGGVKVDLSGNQASGLPVGMRVTNMEDRSGLPATTFTGVYYAGDYRINPLWVYVVQRNVLIVGDRYHVLVADPSEDDQIRDTPNNYKPKWCNEDCVSSSESNSQRLIGTFIFVAILIVYAAYTWYFRSAYNPQKRTVYSHAAGGYIPIESTKIPGFAAEHGVNTSGATNYPGERAPFGGPAEYRYASEMTRDQL